MKILINKVKVMVDFVTSVPDVRPPDEGWFFLVGEIMFVN